MIKKVLAAPIPLGNIEGTGQFQTNLVDYKTTTGTLFSTVISTLTVFAGLAFVIYFMIGGIKWITAGGDKTKVQEAQQQMTQAAIGLIVIVVSYFIAGIVGGVLGIDILNPIKTLGL